MNVVVDTSVPSVFISSMLKKQGVPAQVLDAWRAQLFSDRNVSRHRGGDSIHDVGFSHPPPLSSDGRGCGRLIALREVESTVVPGIADVADAFVRTPKDEIILACVVEPDVDVLVTSDQDLLVPGIIVAPRS